MHKIKNFFGQKKIFQNFFLSFLIFFSFFSPVVNTDFLGFGGENISWAATGDTATKNPNSKVSQFGVEIIMDIVSAITIFTMRIINWAGYLLHPSTVFDPAISSTLKSFRELFKNIILTISVFILIGIALKNLFQLKSLGDLGKDIGKFIVILILINFSWFAVKFVIDIGSIAGRAAFTMYDDFGKESAFTKKGFRMRGPTIVQRTGKGKNKNKKAKLSDFPYDICLIYKDSKKSAKTGRDNIHDGTKGKLTCDTGVDKNKKPIKNKNNITVGHSKNVIVLYPISEDPNLSYDLPTAILWNFIDIEAFYKIGAGTKDMGTLFTESLFAVGTAVIMVISTLAMLIVFLQRLAVLWFYLVASPLYFFEKLLGLINDNWGKFFSSNFPVSNLISNAILMPVGFGLLYSGIAILGGQLFFNDLLAQGVTNFYGIDYKTTNPGNLGSVFKLIIGVGVMVGLWKGTQAIAHSSGGLAKIVVDKSMDAVQGLGYQKLTGMAMNTGLFKVGGQKGLDSDYKASFSDIFSKGGTMDRWANKERIEDENRTKMYKKLYQTDKYIKNGELREKIKNTNNKEEFSLKVQTDLGIKDLTKGFGKDFHTLMDTEYKNLNDFYKNFEKVLPQLTKKYGKEGANIIGQKIVAMNGKSDLKKETIEIRAEVQNHIDSLTGNYKEILGEDILKKIKQGGNTLGLGQGVNLNNKLLKISNDKGISEENLKKAVKEIINDGLTKEEADKLGISIKKDITTNIDYDEIIKKIDGFEKKKDKKNKK